MPRRTTTRVDADAPLYVQIKDALRQRIHDGTYAPQARIPSESELGAEFAVSRITVQRALTDLENERVIFRLAGKGSFVSRPTPVHRLARLEGLAEAMSSLGLEVFNRVLSVRAMAATAEVAAGLAVPPGSPVTEIRRIRHVSRAPVSLDVTYVERGIGERLAREDLATRDIFGIIENDYAIGLGHATLHLDAIAADRATAGHLRVRPGAPLLRIERLTHTTAGKPLDFEYLYCRGDSFRYQLRVERGARSAKSSRSR